MKKRVVLLLMSFFLAIPSVFAKEIYYTNSYDVAFTKEEYDFISMFYFDGYQDSMDQKTYNEFIESNIMNGEIKTVSNEDLLNITPYATMHETNAKIIKITSSCANTECSISTTVTWKNTPTVKSYDVIGAFLRGTSYTGSLKTIVSTSSATYFPTDNVITSNRVATSIKLPSDSTSLKINHYFTTSRSGTVNSSYQHAKKTSTSAKSKQFSFSEAGFGGVFKFNESVKSYYDAMGGVTLKLN